MAESENINFFDEIRSLQAADPFDPFVIVMSSGARYEVTDPYSVMAGMPVFAVYRPKVGVNLFPFHQISSVEVLGAKQPAKRKRARR